MNSYKKTAIIVGILFIIATAAPILSGLFINIINGPDYLTDVYANSVQVTTGALLELIMALAIVGIATTIYPVLKKCSETLASGYMGIRIIEGVIFVAVAVLGLLSLLTLSQEFVIAGSPDVSYFQTIGTLLRSAHDWSYLLSGQVVFPFSALILNFALYRSKLVPKFISVWGLIGAVVLLTGGLSGMFGLFAENPVLETVFFLPIALQEMVFATWLIVKGFNSSAITFLSAKAGVS